MLTCKERANALFEEWAKSPVKACPELFERHFHEQHETLTAQHAADKDKLREQHSQQLKDVLAVDVVTGEQLNELVGYVEAYLRRGVKGVWYELATAIAALLKEQAQHAAEIAELREQLELRDGERGSDSAYIATLQADVKTHRAKVDQLTEQLAEAQAFIKQSEASDNQAIESLAESICRIEEALGGDPRRGSGLAIADVAGWCELRAKEVTRERDDLRAEVERLRGEHGDLAMIVRRLVSHQPSLRTVGQAIDYLSRIGVTGSILREESPDAD